MISAVYHVANVCQYSQGSLKRSHVKGLFKMQSRLGNELMALDRERLEFDMLVLGWQLYFHTMICSV